MSSKLHEFGPQNTVLFTVIAGRISNVIYLCCFRQ